MTSNKFIVAVDGPAGSGKSTVCARLSKVLKWNHINTGKLYRAFAIAASKAGVDLGMMESVSQFVQENLNCLHWDVAADRIYYNSEDLTDSLYSLEAGQQASLIGKYLRVRELLLPVQQKLVAETTEGLIVEGRDIGTVVAPEAQLKVFLTASLDERTKRRAKQLSLDGEGFRDNKSEISAQIQHRDKQDATRESAPMRQAEDAVVMDTSDLDIDTCVERIVEMIRLRQNS